jgi:hypothetical protein
MPTDIAQAGAWHGGTEKKIKSNPKKKSKEANLIQKIKPKKVPFWPMRMVCYRTCSKNQISGILFVDQPLASYALF